jgi:GNAT superfamily N-acetyltransferase
MALILQMTKKLSEPPCPVAVEGVRLRHYRGVTDIEIWLELRRRAFARQKLGVGDWNAEDFAREFLHKTWWRPESMWFAETASSSLMSSAVGTVALARRGDTPDAPPAVHWLAVLPSWRRRGVGRLLITSLEAAVWETGQRQVWLETHAQWSEAARLYESLGYGPA